MSSPAAKTRRQFLRSRTTLLKRLSLLVLVAGSSVQVAHATTGTWGQTATGTYNWSTSGNWSGGNVPGSAAGDQANFTNAITGSNTVTWTGTQTLGILNVTVPSTTGATFTIGTNTGGELLMNNNGSGAQINLTNGANGTGSIIAAPIVIDDSGGLTITVASGTSHSSGISGAITSLGTGSLTIKNNASSVTGLTISGLINNSGSVTNNGAGTSSATTLSGGIGSNVTSITENSTNSTLTISGLLTVNSGGTTLANNNTASFSLTGGSAGTGALAINDTAGGAVNVSTGTLAQTGNLTVTTSGTGTVSISSPITGTDNITLDNNGSGGLTTDIGLSGAINNTGTITNGGTGSSGVAISGNLGNYVQGVIENSAGSKLTLSGTNTSFRSGLTITTGTVSLGSTSALNQYDVVTFGSAGNGSLLLSGNSVTIGGLSGTAAGNTVSDDSSSNAVLTLSVAATSTFTYGGILEDGVVNSGHTLSVTKQGAGTQIFTGASNAYSGTTTVNSGTLESTITSGSPFGAGDIALNGGVLNLTPTNIGAAISLTGAATGAANNDINITGAGDILLNKNGNTSLTYTIGNAGTTAINRVAGGTLIITPASGIANLGTASGEQLILNASSLPTPVNGMVSPYYIGQASASNSNGDFLSYNATTGFTTASGSYTNESGAFTPTTHEISNITSAATIAAGSNPYALRVTSATLTLTGTTTVGSGGVILNTGTLSGGTLAFGTNEGDLYVSGTDATSATNTLTGSGGLTIFGPGTLTLSGTNSVSGGLFINGGLTVATLAPLGTSSQNSTVTFNGGTLNDTAASGSLTPGQTIQINPGGATINVTNGLIFAGSGTGTINLLTGTGALIKTGAGNLRISSASTGFTGDIYVLNGELDVTNGNTGAGSVGAGNPIVLGDVSGSNNVTFNSGGGGFSARSFIVAGGNSGTVIITTGGSGSSPFITSGITLGTSSATANGGVGHSVTLESGGFQNTFFSGVIQDPTNLNPATAGVVTFTPGTGAPLEVRGLNTYSGGSILNAGNIIINGTNTPFGTGTVTVGSGGTTLSDIGSSTLVNPFSLTGNLAFSTSSIGGDNANTNLILSGNVLLSGGGRTVSETSTKTLTLSGVISDNSNNYALTTSATSTGLLILAGANTYGGGTVITGSSGVIGLTQLSGAGTLGSTTGSLTVNSGALDLNGTNQTVGTFSGAGGIVTNNNTTTTATLTTTNATTGSFAGALTNGSQGLALVKNGAGVLTLTGANSFTGGTTVNTGTLVVTGASGAPASQTLTTTSASATITDATTTGLVVGETVSGPGIVAGSYITGITANTSFTISNVVGTGASGSVSYGAYGALGTGSITISGGTLQLGNGTTNAGLPTSQGILDNATLAIDNNGTNQTIANAISGTGLLNVISGSVTLTGANSYNGASNVFGGSTLINGVTNSLPTSTVLTLGASTDGAVNNTFDLHGAPQTVAALDNVSNGGSTNGNFVTNNGGATATLTVSGAGSTNSTFGGVIENGSSLTALAISGGTTTLTGSNTYSGGTTVSGGTLLASNTSAGGSATGTGSLTVGPNATLGGYGASSGSGFSVTGTSTAARASLLVGLNSATDPSVSTSLTLKGSGASSIAYANLTFNINSNVAGGLGTDPTNSGTELSVGSTLINFGSAAKSTLLTLDVQGTSYIGENTPYVLIAGTGSTLNLGTSSSTGQFAGLSTTYLGNNIWEINNSGLNGNGNLALSLTGSAATYYGANSYLFIYQNGSTDDIEVEVIPEPGTWAMMLGGLAMLIFWQRRRQGRR